MRFLSTLSLRRATPASITPTASRRNFYPRSPCGERRYLINTYHRIFGISIHALLAESDSTMMELYRRQVLFLSTLSLRRATNQCKIYQQTCGISIHALLAESDERANRLANAPPHISIHALLAESDTQHFSVCVIQLIFLSTLSLRRATTGGQSCNSTLVHFYPRSPCGERQRYFRYCIGRFSISIHALLAESDICVL